MNRLLVAASVAALSIPLTTSCSEDTELFGSPGGGVSGGSGGSGGTGGTSTTGGGPQGGGGNTTSTGGTGVGGGQGGAGGAICEPEPVGVELPNLDMVIMADRSGSMQTPPKWTDLVSGIGDFATEPRAPGTSVALVYHPVYNSPGSECQASSYATPHVPLTPIPAGGATITSSLASQNTNGPSPWSSVVDGALQFATSHQDQEPEHIVVAVFIVDTNPNACDLVVANVAATAAAALGYNGVRTFGIAFPDVTVANVSSVASAGGTGQAFDLTAPGATAQLQAALNEIHMRVVPCEYPLPDPPSPPLDPDELNLSYTPGGSSTPETIPQVQNDAQCSGAPGWYYDNAGNPTAIMLCPTSCLAIKQDTAPEVEVLFGCPTVEG